MRPIPAALRDFAGRLLAREAGEGRRTEDPVAVLERVCRTLHARLTPLISSAGVHVLLARAITLAAREFEELAGVDALSAPDCSLRGLRQALGRGDPARVESALTAILATFLWLLVEFIGEDLGLRKVHEAWPDEPFRPTGAS